MKEKIVLSLWVECPFYFPFTIALQSKLHLNKDVRFLFTSCYFELRFSVESLSDSGILLFYHRFLLFFLQLKSLSRSRVLHPSSFKKIPLSWLLFRYFEYSNLERDYLAR